MSSQRQRAMRKTKEHSATLLSAVLACPRCQGQLHEFNCANCQLTFPQLDGIPCLFVEPQHSLNDWRNRWRLTLAELDQQATAAQRALEQTAGTATQEPATETPTQTRLNLLAGAYRRQQALLQRALAPLLQEPHTPAPTTVLATQLALRTRLPSHHNLLAYEANLFRDWVWGREENQTALAEVLHVVGEFRPRKILVLGGGGGRLAYDLHQVLMPELTLTLDINPMLALVANQMWQGHKLNLVEFPIAPAQLDESAIEQTLSGSTPTSGLHYVLANALNAPIAAESFDLVITPWLLDVIDAPPEQVVPSINAYLATGGLWINHGSLTFSQADPGSCHSWEELNVLAQDNGFAEAEVQQRSVPYLASPHSRHQRRETLITSGWKKESAGQPVAPFTQLPAWLATGDSSVPLAETFVLQRDTIRIHAFILSLVDGQRSLNDMALLLEENGLLNQQDAATALRGFFLKLLEETAAQRGR